MLLADQELLEQPHLPRVCTRGLQPGGQVVRTVQPVRRLGTSSGRWLRDQGEAHLTGERQRLLGAVDELMAGARDPGGAEDAFHLGLVPDVVRGGHVHPRDADSVSDLGERHLELLESTDQTLDAAQLAAEPPYGAGDLLRVERVVTCQCAARCSLSWGGRSSAATVVIRASRTPGSTSCGVHEPRCGLEEERSDEGGDDHGHGPYADPGRGTSHEASGTRGQ